ncbi:hypothetical protein Tco_0368890 [Tanacetum coccineum]
MKVRLRSGYVAEEALTFCSRYLKDDVETRFNRLGRNDDGLPEEEPDKFQVFRSVCKLTGRMKETRLTPDVRQAVVWFVLNNSPEVDAEILAYREYIREKKVTDGCSEELFSLACGPISACTYPACIVNGVKFVVHERDILHTTQCSGVSTLGLDGEMYYGQLEEILELTYIGHHLARQPRGWKVVEHVYHRDVAESDQDVIHGSSSSHVTLSVGLTNLEHTDLSINAQSTEVDAPPVNDDNANANEDNADFINNEDDVVAPVLVDDDMACLAPRSHGGDAGGSPPRQPNRPVPAQCQSSSLRIETGNASLRKAFRHNIPTTFEAWLLMGETIRPLPLACEWEEIPEAFKAHIFPTLESYFNLAEWYNNQDKVVVGKNVYTVGERVRLGLQLKLRLLWRKNKNRIKAQQYTIYDSPDEAKNHLPPSTVWGERTHDEWNELVDWFSHPIISVEEAGRIMLLTARRTRYQPIKGKKSFAQGRNEYKVEKGHHEDLIQTWKKTHSNSKTGQFKYEENKQRYLKMKAMQDQIRAGVIPYKTDQEILDEVVPSDNRQNMSGMGRKLPGGGSTSRRRANQAFADVMTREQMTQILRQKEQENELLRKQAEEAQQRAYLAALKADSADQRASAAYQNTETMYGAVGQFFSHYNSSNSARPFMPPAFNLVPPPPPATMPQLAPEWAHLLNPPMPYNQQLPPHIEQLAQDNATEDNNEEEDEQQSGGDYSSDEEAEYEEEE